MSLEQQLAGLNSNLSCLTEAMVRIADALEGRVHYATDSTGKTHTVVGDTATGEVGNTDTTSEEPQGKTSGGTSSSGKTPLQLLKEEAIELGADRDSVINLRKPERVQEIIDQLKTTGPVEEEEEETQTSAAAQTVEEDDLDIPTLRDKLKKVAADKGMDTAQEVLKEFGVNKITELNPEDFQEFSDRCDVLLGGDEDDDMFG